MFVSAMHLRIWSDHYYTNVLFSGWMWRNGKRWRVCQFDCGWQSWCLGCMLDIIVHACMLECGTNVFVVCLWDHHCFLCKLAAPKERRHWSGSAGQGLGRSHSDNAFFTKQIPTTTLFWMRCEKAAADWHSVFLQAPVATLKCSSLHGCWLLFWFKPLWLSGPSGSCGFPASLFFLFKSFLPSSSSGFQIYVSQAWIAVLIFSRFHYLFIRVKPVVLIAFKSLLGTELYSSIQW